MEKGKQTHLSKSTTQFIMLLPLENVRHKFETRTDINSRLVYSDVGKATYEIAMNRFISENVLFNTVFLVSFSRWNDTETKVILLNLPESRWTIITKLLVLTFVVLIVFAVGLAFTDPAYMLFPIWLVLMPLFLYTRQQGMGRVESKQRTMEQLKRRREVETALDSIIASLTNIAETDYMRST